MTQVGANSLGTRSTMDVGGKTYAYYSLRKAAEKIGDVSKLPHSMKVLLENLLRFEDEGFTVGEEHIRAIAGWQHNPVTGEEIQYRPARVLLQDFTGVPCVVDLAAMRDAIVICAVTPGRRLPSACYESALMELACLVRKAGARGVIHFSSSGIYDGLKGDIDESAALNECSERAQKLLAGERALQQVPCCITLRLAGLIGPGRHPGHFVAGKALNEPEAPVNMVHSEDIIAAVSLLLEQDVLSGNIFNLNCPGVVSRRVFYTQAVQNINADIIFSSENLAEDASGRRVNPNKFIQAYGYNYRFKSACDALQHCD